jgi:hypothetical protein
LSFVLNVCVSPLLDVKVPVKKSTLSHIYDGALSTEFEGMSSDAVNEKPPGLISFFIKNHLRPGDWCLVIGAGAGGDIQGCVDMNTNVVGIEKDKFQWGACINRFTAYREELEKKSKIEEVVDEELEDDGDDNSDDKPAAHAKSNKRRKDIVDNNDDNDEVASAKKTKLNDPCKVCGSDDDGSPTGECSQCQVKCHESCLWSIPDYQVDLVVCSEEFKEVLIQSSTPNS